MPFILQWLLAALIAIAGAAFTWSRLRPAGHPRQPSPSAIYLAWALVVSVGWACFVAMPVN